MDSVGYIYMKEQSVTLRGSGELGRNWRARNGVDKLLKREILKIVR